MFEIAVEQRQYKTYVLADQLAHSRLEVVPERGGIVIGWQVDGKDIFYLDDERFKDAGLSVRGGIPLLFPICGNLVDDSYTIDSEVYTLKQHGFGRTSTWVVTQQSTDDCASLTVTLKSNDDTRSGYPFDFELNYTYILRGNTLELRQQHTNLSNIPMPFSTGIHPYFAVDNAAKSGLKITLPSTQYQIKSDPEIFNFSGQFDFDQDEIDFAFIDLTGNKAEVIDPTRGSKLTIEFDQHYSTLVFWSVKGKDFYCVEPWTGPRNAMITGKNLLTIAPQETLETVIKMTVEPF